MKLFGKEEVNTGRQMFIDLAKVIAIVFMVADHTWMYGGTELHDTWGLILDGVLGGPFAAPVFMTCMGIGVTYSHRSDAKSMMLRGLRLLMAGYILNLIRFLGAAAAFLCKDNEINLSDIAWILTEVDILPFAGMAFLLLALLRYLKASTVTTVLVGLVMSVIGSFVHQVNTGCLAVDFLLSPIIGVSTETVYSSFPLANWFIFVALGIAAGKMIRRSVNLDILFAWLTPFSAVIFLGLSIWMIKEEIGLYSSNEDYFYHLTTFDSLGVCLPAILLMLGLSHFGGKLLQGSSAELVRRTSVDLNRIYLIHWVIIIWIVYLILYSILGWQLSSPMRFLISLVILLISTWLARHKPFSNIKL